MSQATRRPRDAGLLVIVLFGVLALPVEAGATGASGTQSMTVTVPAGTLSIALQLSSIDLESVGGGSASGPVSVGPLTYANTLDDGLGWSASVSATDLGNGQNSFISATDLTYTPSPVIIQPGDTAPDGGNPTAGTGGPFTFSCQGGSDAVQGTSYSCPLSLFSAPIVNGTTAQGDWQQLDNTVSLSVPPGQAAGSYSGTLQYSITG